MAKSLSASADISLEVLEENEESEIRPVLRAVNVVVMERILRTPY